MEQLTRSESELPTTSAPSSTWWIIGGGPSREKFDLSRIVRSEDVKVLAVNDAIKFYPGADAIFSLDNRWIKKNKAFLRTTALPVYLAVPLETWPECFIDGAHYFQWSHADGLSDNPLALCVGGNSGYAVINLAYLRGAREVHLVGFDLDPVDEEQYIYWALAFHTMAPQLDAKGVKVLNHNPGSFITAFPRVL